jgi:hypothetical protein
LLRAAWLIGTALVAIAGVLALDRRWGPAGASVLLGLLLLWLAGQWVFPRGHDALARHYSRVMYAWKNWATALESAFAASGPTDPDTQWRTDRDVESDRVMRAGKTLVRKLEKMKPPAQVAGEHQSLVAGLRRYHAALGDYYATYRQVSPGQTMPSETSIKSAGSDLEVALDSLYDRLRELEAWDVPEDANARR